ncbi:MAG: class 1 fructose-bisphosphatase [Sphingobacteriales bacterium]|jgi:fructose-1,6-bisphosphatase I|nr:class 1 fructose-bisphosphatase [Sphingobacteriales bacterium]
MSITTLGQFIIEKQQDFPYAKGELSRILRDIGIAAKMISAEVNKAGLTQILGEHGSVNVQGEDVKKLDIIGNETFIWALEKGGEICAMASEENDDMIPLQGAYSKNGKYVICIDPLDGSSNIDVNVSIGTIFSVYRRVTEPGTEPTLADVLQKGSELVAGGYVIYGSSTMLVYSTGKGVNGFTLDPSIGEFCLSHPNIKTPADGKIYSINEGNAGEFPAGVSDYLKWVKETDKATNRPYSARYIGSMVADFHRNLLKGGVFIYPPTAKAPKGKLRLLFECIPMGYIAIQAGGAATTGVQSILDVEPTEIHQRVPIVMGSKNMVEKVLSFGF